MFFGPSKTMRSVHIVSSLNADLSPLHLGREMRAWFGRCGRVDGDGEGAGPRRCVALVADVRVANVGVSDDLVDNLAGRLVRHAVGRREDDVRLDQRPRARPTPFPGMGIL